ncbi:hypothetical protein HDK64DRAFT_118756 [Phyllosticta capitalensis]
MASHVVRRWLGCPSVLTALRPPHADRARGTRAVGCEVCRPPGLELADGSVPAEPWLCLSFPSPWGMTAHRHCSFYLSFATFNPLDCHWDPMAVVDDH